MAGRIQRPENRHTLELPEIGRLHVGMKSEKGYPTSIDWFRATGKYADQFMRAYGAKPSTIQVVFPSDDVEKVCNERYEYRDQAGALLARGDGNIFELWNGAKYVSYSVEQYPDFMRWVVENYPTKRGADNWEISLTLRFIIPAVRGIVGVWQFTTKGKASSVNNIRNSFDSVLQMRQTVTTTVFDLSVHFHKSNKPGQNSRYPVVELVANDTRVEDIRKMLQQENTLKILENDRS